MASRPRVPRSVRRPNNLAEIEACFRGLNPSNPKHGLYTKLERLVQEDCRHESKVHHWIWYLYPQYNASPDIHSELTETQLAQTLLRRFPKAYGDLLRLTEQMPLTWFSPADKPRVQEFRRKNAVWLANQKITWAHAARAAARGTARGRAGRAGGGAASRGSAGGGMSGWRRSRPGLGRVPVPGIPGAYVQIPKGYQKKAGDPLMLINPRTKAQQNIKMLYLGKTTSGFQGHGVGSEHDNDAAGRAAFAQGVAHSLESGKERRREDDELRQVLEASMDDEWLAFAGGGAAGGGPAADFDDLEFDRAVANSLADKPPAFAGAADYDLELEHVLDESIESAAADSDLARALEESLMEAQGGTKGPRGGSSGGGSAGASGGKRGSDARGKARAEAPSRSPPIHDPSPEAKKNRYTTASSAPPGPISWSGTMHRRGLVESEQLEKIATFRADLADRGIGDISDDDALTWIYDLGMGDVGQAVEMYTLQFTSAFVHLHL